MEKLIDLTHKNTISGSIKMLMVWVFLLLGKNVYYAIITSENLYFV